MISSYFIDRPIFASVISAFIVIAGLAALRVLPVAQYPDILPPEVEVQAFYPGANAETVAQTVAAPLDQAINGVDGMLYLRSASAGNGALNMTVTFAIGTDPDLAAINVNNRVQSAMSTLPEEVRRQGVRVHKRSMSFLQDHRARLGRPAFRRGVHLELRAAERRRRAAPHPGRRRRADLRRQGLLDPCLAAARRLAKLGLTPADVAAAIREQNAQFAAGRVGEEPMNGAVDFTFSVTTQGRLTESRGVRQDRHPHHAGRRHHAARGRGASRARLARLRLLLDAQRQAHGADRHLPAAGRQRTRSRRRRGRPHGGAGQALPGRARLQRALRHDDLHQGLDPRGADDAGRGDAARVRRRVPVPAELAGDAHPDAGRAGVADRHAGRHARCSASRSTR